jgi:hypothetical protein
VAPPSSSGRQWCSPLLGSLREDGWEIRVFVLATSPGDRWIQMDGQDLPGWLQAQAGKNLPGPGPGCGLDVGSAASVAGPRAKITAGPLNSMRKFSFIYF